MKAIICMLFFMSLLHHQLHHAAAASGGRMGGTSFSRSSSTSSRGRSTSTYYYRIPRSRSTYYSTKSDHNTYICSTSPYSTSQNTQMCIPSEQIKFGISDWCFIIITTVIVVIYVLLKLRDLVKTCTVLKLQVGLSGKARSLQKDLNHIARTADTSSPNGFVYVLQETTLSLLHHLDYWISGYSSVEVKMGVEDCKKQFNKLSTQERGKFNEETLVNFNNIRKQSETSYEDVSNVVSNEYIVVTIIVAASGVHQFPQIKSNELLKEALQMLASIPSNNVLAAEVLWTPQKEDDCLTEQEMLEDYPLLHFL